MGIVKNRRDRSDSDSAALGPEPAVPQTGLTPAVAFVHEHLAAQAGAVTISALAAMTGLHQNTVREHLDQLVEAGAATKSKAASSGRGRPAWLYRAIGSPRKGASEYLGLASVLAAQIDRTSPNPRADGIAAGIDWGRDLARGVAEMRVDAEEAAPAESTATDETLALLDSLGFAPEPVPAEATDAGRRSFRLTRCPLLEAAHEYPDIVCGVHLGLVRGSLESFGGPGADSELEPFSEPGACRLHLHDDTVADSPTAPAADPQTAPASGESAGPAATRKPLK